MRDRTLRVAPGDAGTRLDRWLKGAFPGLPPRSVRYALSSGAVTVGGRPAKRGRVLSGGEDVFVRELPEEEDWLPAPGEVPGAGVLCDDGVVAVLDKPAGVHAEAQKPGEARTMAGFLRLRHPDAGPGAMLSRLDRDTSGAILCALTEEARRFLRREREEGGIRKGYLCLVEGEMAGGGRIDRVLETRGGERVRVLAGRREEDPLYHTVVDPISTDGSVTLVRAEIARGKRHQIRAHLAAIGHPIVGDPLYSGKPARTRLMLHAAELHFRHPATGGETRVESPLPPDFGKPGAIP